MKRIAIILVVLMLTVSICACGKTDRVQIAATTLPTYEFTATLCQGTDIMVGQLITENISCLHDYTLHTTQMQMIEHADHIVISGVGLESFLGDVLTDSSKIIDASTSIPLLETCAHDEHSEHDHDTYDPHIWLSPDNAKIMAQNICQGLTKAYPEHTETFTVNLCILLEQLDELKQYAAESLSDLSCREIITFHDGFTYMADAYNLTILHVIEEESGSEASAAELIELIELVNEHSLSAIFTETNGSRSAAGIIGSETGAKIYTLDMCLSGDSYINAMYQNIRTLKEALG